MLLRFAKTPHIRCHPCTEAAAIPGELLPRGVRALSRGLAGRMQGHRWVDAAGCCWVLLRVAVWMLLGAPEVCMSDRLAGACRLLASARAWQDLRVGKLLLTPCNLYTSASRVVCDHRAVQITGYPIAALPPPAGHKFVKGEPRFVLTAGDPQKKCYLSLPAAGAELAPVAEQVGCSWLHVVCGWVCSCPPPRLSLRLCRLWRSSGQL